VSELACYHCGQMGHLRASCPVLHPPAPTPAAPAPRRHQADVECPTCQRDWVAVLPYEGASLETLTCPWCRKFETRDGEVYHRSGVTP